MESANRWVVLPVMKSAFMIASTACSSLFFPFLMIFAASGSCLAVASLSRVMLWIWFRSRCCTLVCCWGNGASVVAVSHTCGDHSSMALHSTNPGDGEPSQAAIPLVPALAPAGIRDETAGCINDLICFYYWKQWFRTLDWGSMCSNPCGSVVTCFRPESNRGPYGLLNFLCAALSTTELWWRINHRTSFGTLT